MPQKVAILIPTMNRSDFLIRQLLYYASVKSPHPVYIGDASNQEHRGRTEQAINELQNQVDIHYHHWQKLNDRQTIKRLGEVAEEVYCAFTGDDDFLIPDSLSECAEFLAKSPEYRTAQGKGVIFTLGEPGPFGAINGLGTYWGKKEVLHNTGAERILYFGKNYWVPQFSVHRRKEFLEDSLHYGEITDKSFGELLHSFTFISKGKSKFVDCLYLIRQGHDAQHTLPDTFDWLISLDWQPSFQLFVDSISEAIEKVDGIHVEEAKEAVKQAFLFYFLKSFGARNHFKKNKYQKLIKDWIKGFPIMRKVVKNVRIIRSKITAKTGELSLPALLNSSSPYYKHFVSVYNVITNKHSGS